LEIALRPRLGKLDFLGELLEAAQEILGRNIASSRFIFADRVVFGT
jgi:hypothetical protein